MSTYFEIGLLDLFKWTICGLGISHIITSAYIFKPLRYFLERKSSFIGKLINCPICFSFWVSLMLGMAYYSPTGNLFLDGCLGSGFMWLFTKKPQLPDEYCECEEDG